MVRRSPDRIEDATAAMAAAAEVATAQRAAAARATAPWVVGRRPRRSRVQGSPRRATSGRGGLGELPAARKRDRKEARSTVKRDDFGARVRRPIPRRCDPTSDTVSRLNETDRTKERELAAERKRISGEGRRRTKGWDDEGKKSDP